jgi:hypothetical protein
MNRMLTAFAILLLMAAPRINAACTATTLAGTFGFTTSGVLILPTGPAPVAAVGLITFDLNGNVSGTQDRSVGGGFAHETISGTISITRDCVLNLVANVYDNSGNLVRTSVIPGVLTENEKKLRAVFESVTIPNGPSLSSVLAVEGERIRGHAD